MNNEHQPTEADIALARAIMHSGHYGAYNMSTVAQLISAHCAKREQELTNAILAEKDRCIAYESNLQVAELRITELNQSVDMHAHALSAFKERAENAEAQLHALRLVCGTTDANKFETACDRALARAEEAERELAEARKDSERLDWLLENANSIAINDFSQGDRDVYYLVPIARTSIDACRNQAK